MGTLLPPPRRVTRVWALVLGVPFLLGLALLTLTPSRIEHSVPNLLDVIVSLTHRLGWTAVTFTRLEVLSNIAVFVPLGVLAFLLLPRRVWPLSLMIGPVASLAIETAQRIALPHRDATMNDVWPTRPARRWAWPWPSCARCSPPHALHGCDLLGWRHHDLARTRRLRPR